MVLSELAARVRQASPEHPPRTDQLLAHVAERVPEDADLIRLLRRLNVEDLALAWACCQGHAGAMAQPVRRHFSVIDQALSQLPDAAGQLSEIKQLLRQRLKEYV